MITPQQAVDMASRWARPTSSLSFADEGNVMANSIASFSFEYRFKLHLIVTDDAGDAGAIMVTLAA